MTYNKKAEEKNMSFQANEREEKNDERNEKDEQRNDLTV